MKSTVNLLVAVSGRKTYCRDRLIFNKERERERERERETAMLCGVIITVGKALFISIPNVVVPVKNGAAECDRFTA